MVRLISGTHQIAIVNMSAILLMGNCFQGFVTMLMVLAAVPAGCDMPMCNSSNPDFSKSPYCLPDDYNKDIVPPTQGRPLHINVDIWVFEVRKHQLGT